MTTGGPGGQRRGEAAGRGLRRLRLRLLRCGADRPGWAWGGRVPGDVGGGGERSAGVLSEGAEGGRTVPNKGMS